MIELKRKLHDIGKSLESQDQIDSCAKDLSQELKPEPKVEPKPIYPKIPIYVNPEKDSFNEGY